VLRGEAGVGKTALLDCSDATQASDAVSISCNAREAANRRTNPDNSVGRSASLRDDERGLQ
jgi:hypothetical protein